MQLDIITRNIDKSLVEQQVNKKIGKLDRYMPTLDGGKVEISEQKSTEPERRYTIQVTLNSKGTIIRTYVEAIDVMTAIDRATQILKKRIERYQGKRQDKRKGIDQRKSEGDLGGELQGLSPEIIKRKHFKLTPMSVDEAIEQMELLGHNFFLFIEEETGRINLIYRRRDKNYGIIETEG
jgi:putative sigma-54 modulation protein